VYFAHNIRELNQTTPNMSMHRRMISYASMLLTIIQLVGRCLFSQFCDVAPLVIIALNMLSLHFTLMEGNEAYDHRCDVIIKLMHLQLKTLLKTFDNKLVIECIPKQ